MCCIILEIHLKNLCFNTDQVSLKQVLVTLLWSFLSYWIISLLPLVLLPHPSSLCELGSPSKQEISEGLNYGTAGRHTWALLIQLKEDCGGSGRQADRLALSRPFSYIFFELTFIDRSNEAKVEKPCLSGENSPEDLGQQMLTEFHSIWRHCPRISCCSNKTTVRHLRERSFQCGRVCAPFRSSPAKNTSCRPM